MAEWSIAAVLKTVDPHGSGGSNPSLSAARRKTIRISKLYQASLIFCFKTLRQSQAISRSRQAKSCRFLAFKFCKKNLQNSENCQTERMLYATLVSFVSARHCQLHNFLLRQRGHNCIYNFSSHYAMNFHTYFVILQYQK